MTMKSRKTVEHI